MRYFLTHYYSDQIDIQSGSEKAAPQARITNIVNTFLACDNVASVIDMQTVIEGEGMGEEPKDEPIEFADSEQVDSKRGGGKVSSSR